MDSVMRERQSYFPPDLHVMPHGSQVLKLDLKLLYFPATGVGLILNLFSMRDSLQRTMVKRRGKKYVSQM